MKHKLLALLAAALLILGGCAQNKKTEPQTVSMPIILYHHIDDTGEGLSTIEAGLFREHMLALKEAGYHTISFDELINFVNGEKLPEKPILVTFDDGYGSFYDRAFPVFKELDMKATVFAIGVSIGRDTYKDTGNAMIPHFGWDEAREMIDSGLVSVQSHTYDMHQVEIYDGADCRKGVQMLPGETEAQYREAYLADIGRSISEIESNTGEKVRVIAYPFGLTSESTDGMSRELGLEVTLTTIPAGNTVTQGDVEQLYGLNRFSIDDISAQELLELIGGENG